jgi:LmbE family N-acetylglucosaminyl deacetylase
MLARIMHKKFGLRDQDVMDVRLREDQDACSLLGADTIHAGLPECLYRFDEAGNPKYRKLNELFEQPPYAEPETRADIRDCFNRIDFSRYDRIYIPLGVGRHIDHLLVREAAEYTINRTGQSFKLLYYRDLPYFCYGTDLNWRSELAHGLQESRVTLPAVSLRHKLAAIERYRSQLAMLWPSRFRMLRQLAAHARSFNDSHLRIPEGNYDFPLYTRIS